MNKREFLKAGGAGILAAAAARPASAVAPSDRIAILQQHLPGAEAFAERERATGARVLIPTGDPVRWFRSTLQPVLGTATVVGFTDATHALILETSLREAGYARAVTPAHSARGTLWSAAPRT
jgi:ornithine cyclodeaminase/alanine dehydrogenase-like protein (mu-crystallin family)